MVTITETGYAKRTKTDLYRSQKRGGKGVQGAGLKQDDIVNHFFVCSTHDWILFFTTQGRVYRAKAYELPEASRTARGQHVANLLAFQPEERIAQVIQIKSYEDAPYLVLATRNGLVKKSRLIDFDSNRSGRHRRDQPEGWRRTGRRGVVLGRRRSAAGVGQGPVDPVLGDRRGAAAHGSCHLRCAGHAVQRRRRAAVAERGAARYISAGRDVRRLRQADRDRGVPGAGPRRQRGPDDPVRQTPWQSGGALIVDDDTELYAITSGGGVIRTAARQVRKAGRQTKGVRLMNLGEGDTLIAIARNAEEGDRPTRSTPTPAPDQATRPSKEP